MLPAMGLAEMIVIVLVAARVGVELRKIGRFVVDALDRAQR
jgi:hypothetical protein